MTGGWGKLKAVLLTGAAAIALDYGIAGAQVAPVSGSTTTQQTTTTTTTTTANPVSGAPAQAPAPSLSVTGTFRSEFKIDDNGGLRQNSPGNDTTFVNRLGIDVNSATPTQTLVLSFGGLLQWEDLAADREESGFEDPFVRLSYRLEGVESELRFNVDYRTDDIINSVLIDTDGDLIDDTLLTTSGKVENIRYGVNYSFGLQAPFGMDFDLQRSERNYSDVVSPNLFDRTTDQYGVVARFAISPSATARLVARATRYDAEDGPRTERDTTNLGAGLSYEIRPDLTFDGQITQTNIDETVNAGAGRRTTKSDGLTANAQLTRELTNGTLGVYIDRVQSTNTARTDFGFNRSMVLPSGSLSFGAGISSSDTGNNAVVASVAYSNQLPTGTLTARVNRTATVNSRNSEVQRSLVGLGYLHTINANSAINFGLDVASVKDIGLGSVSEATRTDVRVEYRYQINRDWDWRFGYIGRIREDSAGTTASSNAIVTSIGRSFSIRP